jgi:hypothetical protein
MYKAIEIQGKNLHFMLDILLEIVLPKDMKKELVLFYLLCIMNER